MKLHLANVNAASNSGRWAGQAKLTKMARVEKRFTCDGRTMKVGEVLSPDQISKVRRDNRAALISGGFIRILLLSAEIAGS